MFQFECNAKLLLNFITHPVFIHASRIVRFDNVDETHDVVFRDKACDDGIHGRVLPYTGRVHQHYPALQYIKEVTSGTLKEMDGNWLFHGYFVCLFLKSLLRIFRSCGYVTDSVKGCKILAIYISALMAFEKGGIFIVTHLL